MAAMNDVPREILHAAYKRNPLYLLKIPHHFALWGLCGYLLWSIQGQSTPIRVGVGVLCSLFIANIVRGLGAVGHDAAHGTVLKSKTATYWLGLLCWAPSGMSFTVYQNYHLHHHRITNTYPDVDNFVVTDYTKDKTLARLLTLVVYAGAYPIYFLTQIVRYVPRLTPWQKIRMNLELVAWWGFVGFCAWKLPGEFVFFMYFLPFIFGSILASVTSMIEHFQMDWSDDDAYSSRTYATNHAFLNYIWNNLGYHNEHHKYPGIPWYNLRSFYVAAYPYYDERIKKECYPGFFSVIWMLWKRAANLDVEAIEKKYATLNREEEKQKHMAMPGISPETA